ncbi:LysR substrate-binding domain-containing protein [Pseudomonas tumuqii]
MLPRRPPLRARKRSHALQPARRTVAPKDRARRRWNPGPETGAGAVGERVAQLVQDAEAVLRPAAQIDPKQLLRTFTLRSSEGFVENFGPALIARIAQEAPGVRLCFMQKPDKDSTPLRDGTVDLETGVVGQGASPELRTQALFRDRFIGVVRLGHPLSQGEVTPARYAAGGHIYVSRRGLDKGPIDEALKSLGLAREVMTIVAGFSTALALARATELIVNVPERHTASLRAGMHSFPLPLTLPTFTVAMLWHPRMDADPAHRWLRACLRVCKH